jgi:hypothetical protein
VGHRLRVFEIMVLGRLFGPKKEEVASGWTRWHNEWLHNLYALSYIIRAIKSSRMRWVGHVARMKEMRNADIILIEKPEGKRALGRPRRKLEDNIKMDLWEVGWEVVDWMHLAQVRDQ